MHVLGVLWTYPPDKTWNQRVLQRRLRTARAALFPAALSQGSTTIVDDSIPPGDWEKTPAATRARMTQAAARLGKPPQRYFSHPPLMAGYLLVSDFRDSMGWKAEALMAQVGQAVTKAGVEGRNAAVLPADRYIKAWSSATSEAGQTCLDAALAEVEGGSAPMREAIDGWALGDVAAALAAPRGLELCGFALPGQGDLRRAAIDAQVEAIAKALNGETGARPTASYVAVANLRTLLAQDGVLDKLRQRGYQVRSPQD
ncbi:MAG: polysaccharide biosynthesis protein GumN [Caulobacteraceae bacterium]|nr:polysaccharide biosynthesis protein GumN [Caulobacteraceae bacterium]